ncbi:MAG: carboxypeptidase regulatory-like domain-containing protein [Planctomycetes bacterium]|nr:carboxypeptidase regulatory-like domain-containing protein [Planctomycetota bacterium]
MNVLRRWWWSVLSTVLLPGQDVQHTVVRGRVLGRDGAPLAGAAVFAMDNGRGGRLGPTADPLAAFLRTRVGDRSARQRLWATMRTDANGVFSLLVPADSCDLFVQHEHYADAERLNVDVAKAARDGFADVALHPGVMVRGLVTDGKGVPLADAQVRLMSAAVPGLLQATPGRERGLAVTTDRHGRFEFLHLPADHRVTVFVGRGGYASQSLAAKTSTLAAAPQVYALREQPATAGIVVGVRGRPLPGVRLFAKDRRPANRAAPQVTSGADGSFELLDLEGQEVAVTLQADGYFTRTVQLPIGSCGHRLELVTLPELRLRVLGADGKRVAAFRVTLTHGTTVLAGRHERQVGADAIVAEADGEWAVLPPVPQGRIVAFVDDGVHARAEVELPPLEPGVLPKVVVRLEPGAVLAGQVVGPDGKPLAGARITSAADGPDLFDEPGVVPTARTVPKLQPRSAFTDMEGRFELAALEPGEHVVRVRHPGYCGADLREIAVTAGRRADLGAITLPRGAEVAGRFGKGKGIPRRQLELVAVPTGGPAGAGQRRWRTVTDDNGEFRFLEQVPAGRYVLSHHSQALWAAMRKHAIDVEVEVGAALAPVFLELTLTGLADGGR